MKSIFLYMGRGPTPDEAWKLINNQTLCRVVDSYGDNLIVEGTPTELALASRFLRGWAREKLRSIDSP